MRLNPVCTWVCALSVILEHDCPCFCLLLGTASIFLPNSWDEVLASFSPSHWGMYLLSSKIHVRQPLSRGTSWPGCLWPGCCLSGLPASCLMALPCQQGLHSFRDSRVYSSRKSEPLRHSGNLKLAVYSIMAQLPLRRKLSSDVLWGSLCHCLEASNPFLPSECIAASHSLRR